MHDLNIESLITHILKNIIKPISPVEVYFGFYLSRVKKEYKDIYNYVRLVTQTANSIDDVKGSLPEQLHYTIDELCKDSDLSFFLDKEPFSKYESKEHICKRYKDTYDDIYMHLVDNIVKD